MVRAIFTAVVMSLLVATLGTAALVTGFVYRSPRFFAANAAFWGRVVMWCAGARLSVSGQARVADGRPRVFLANHQSALDIPVLLAVLDGNVRFVAKDSLFRIPLFGWIIHQAGFVPIDRSSARATAATLERMLARIRESPISLVVFPEGTRTHDGSLGSFRRGTMKIAQRCGLPVVPVTIDGSFAVKPRNRFAVRPGPVRLVFHEPIAAEQAAAASSAELQDRIAGTIAAELGRPVPVGAAGAAVHRDTGIGAAPQSS